MFLFLLATASLNVLARSFDSPSVSTMPTFLLLGRSPWELVNMLSRIVYVGTQVYLITSHDVKYRITTTHEPKYCFHFSFVIT